MLQKSIYYENFSDINYFIIKNNLCVNEAFAYACKIGRINSVKHILKLNPDIDYNQVLYYKAIINNSLTSKRQLINNIPLIAAIKNNNIDTVKFLINNGAKLYGFELSVAVSFHSIDIIKYLVEECKVDINFYDGYALRIVCTSYIYTLKNIDIYIMHYLVDKGADVMMTYKKTEKYDVKKILSLLYIEYQLHKDINLKK